ncbi:MAG TPA: serine/threonine-protein kinase, partial [Longimicrobium sp.]|nr:serine/threonine-protein kinase [Longimicrobium sp.]
MAGILSLLMGRELCGRYRVDSVIGTGGMGAVCRGYDVKLERRVAVKVMTAVVKDEEEQERLRGRFYREARAAARLRHPHVVTVHDFGTDEALGIDFLVMELLEGRDLAARLRQAGGPLPLGEAMEVLREGCMGLAAGHRAGLVHRDVKPGNVYLVEERGGWEVKLLDFGIALMNDFEGDTVTRFTVAGAPHTPRYASPEQLAGGASLTPASDVYSLALTGLEMLGGEYPQGLNADPDPRAAARAVKRLVDRRPEVPLRLAAVLRRALRIDPAGRFADANELLEGLLEVDAIAATSAGRPAYTFEREAAPTPPPPTAAASAATPPDDRSVGTQFAPPPGPKPDPLSGLRPPLDGAALAATGTAA